MAKRELTIVEIYVGQIIAANTNFLKTEISKYVEKLKIFNI